MAQLDGLDTQHLVSDLQATIGDQRWRVWFEGATAFDFDDDALRVGVANCFLSDYIRSHFAEAIAACVRRRLGRDVPLAFRVDPALYRRRRAQTLEDTEDATDALEAAPAPAPAARPARPSPMAAASPLFTFDSFVVGPCNEMAHAAARAAADAPGRDFHPLFIHGACGLGKTHLLYAILHTLRQKQGLRVALLSAEQFTNRFLAGMRQNTLDAFRHRYRNLDVLAIDDVHFLGGKKSTQEEFLHTFNEFDGPGRLVILASDAAPREIQAVQDRLVNRWVAGMVCRLSHPDAETRRRLLAHKARHLGRPLPPDVLEMLAHQPSGSVRELEGMLTRLIAYAGLLKQPVTVELARQVLADFAVHTPPALNLGDIEAEACAFFGVTTADIHSRRKSRLVSLARQVSMVLGRELTDLSYAEIARLMGGKNHTTVLAACKKWRGLVEGGEDVSWTDRAEHRAMKAEALLAHLKDRLRR